MLSFDGENYLGTKVRLKYATMNDAMLASLEDGAGLAPESLGLENQKTDDDHIIADFFEQEDRRFFNVLNAEDDHHEGIYLGHFDQYRYYDFKPTTSYAGENLIVLSLSAYSETIPFIPITSLNYTSGSIVMNTWESYHGNAELTIFSSKRTQKAGSDSVVLDSVHKLPGDSQYFTPLTDDYAYVIKYCHPDAGDGIYEYEVELYSFDNNGNLVQLVHRMYYSGLLPGGNYLIEGYYDNFTEQQLEQNMVVYDKTNGVIYEDKVALYGADVCLDSGISEDSTQKENLQYDLTTEDQHEGFYFSKP